MGYWIYYQRYGQHQVERQYEAEHHLALCTAEAILIEGHTLLKIQSIGDLSPLSVEAAIGRRDSKAAYCRALGRNDYAAEEAMLVARFRSVHLSN